MGWVYLHDRYCNTSGNFLKGIVKSSISHEDYCLDHGIINHVSFDQATTGVGF